MNAAVTVSVVRQLSTRSCTGAAVSYQSQNHKNTSHHSDVTTASQYTARNAHRTCESNHFDAAVLRLMQHVPPTRPTNGVSIVRANAMSDFTLEKISHSTRMAPTISAAMTMATPARRMMSSSVWRASLMEQ